MNGLNLKSMPSSVKQITEFEKLDDVSNYIKNDSYVVAYLDNEVLFGVYNNSEFEFPNNKKVVFEYLKRIRIFNETEELHIWFSKGKLKGRYRKDEEGNETDIVEANQVVYGTKYESDDMTLIENRGTKIVLPNKFVVDEKKNRVAIKTRHYIKYLNGFQASFCDARFVRFVQLPENGGE